MKLIVLIVVLGLACAPNWLFATSLLTVNKASYESFDLSVDFTPVIGSDGLILNAVESFDMATNDNSTSEIIAASPAPSVTPNTDVVVFRVQGGNLNEVHLIDVQVIDQVNGQQFEGQITLRITSVP